MLSLHHEAVPGLAALPDAESPHRPRRHAARDPHGAAAVAARRTGAAVGGVERLRLRRQQRARGARGGAAGRAGRRRAGRAPLPPAAAVRARRGRPAALWRTHTTSGSRTRPTRSTSTISAPRPRCRRVHHPHRLAVVGASREELVARLAEAAESSRRRAARPRPPASPSSSRGRERSGRGWDGSCSSASPCSGADRGVRSSSSAPRPAGRCSTCCAAATASGRLGRTELAQPAIFALQVGLAGSCESWGIVPTAVTGHSVGEIAAAHVAGALTLPDAVRVVVHRARLMQRAEGRGRMVSVDLPEAEALAAIAAAGDRLAVAAVNAPDHDGPGRRRRERSRRRRRPRAAGRGLPVARRELRVPQPPDGSRCARRSSRRSRGLRPSPPAHAARVDRDGPPGRCGRETSRPSTGAATSGSRSASPARSIRLPAWAPQRSWSWARIPRSAAPSRERSSAGQLGRRRPGLAPARPAGGCRRARARRPALAARPRVEWSALYPGPRRWVSLPPTPWQRESHPPRVGAPAAGLRGRGAGAAGRPPAPRASARDRAAHVRDAARPRGARLSRRPRRSTARRMLPATALVEMALHAGSRRPGPRAARLDELVIRAPLPLDGGRVVQLTVSSDAADGGALRLFSRPAGDEAAAGPWDAARHRHGSAPTSRDRRPSTARRGAAGRRSRPRARVVRDGERPLRALSRPRSGVRPGLPRRAPDLVRRERGARRGGAAVDARPMPTRGRASTRLCSTPACRWWPARSTPTTPRSWCRWRPTRSASSAPLLGPGVTPGCACRARA